VARFVHNDRLIDRLTTQAFSSLRASPGSRAYYDRQRARDLDHHSALRQLANRLVGILHGCLKTCKLYDEATAWSHRKSGSLTKLLGCLRRSISEKPLSAPKSLPIGVRAPPTMTDPGMTRPPGCCSTVLACAENGDQLGLISIRG
jgi:hypothetical protein